MSEVPPDVPAAQPEPQRPPRRMTAGRVVALVLGVVVGIGSLAALAAGISGLVIDQTQRDSGDFLTTGSVQMETGSYAIVGSALDIDTDAPDWLQADDLLGEVQLRVDGGDRDVFVGLARESDAAGYLAGLGYDEVTEISGDGDGGEVDYVAHSGGAPQTTPAEQRFWAVEASGTGDQTLTFEPRDGRWVVVAMNADGSQGVDVTARAAAELPVLTWVAVAVTAAGVFGLGLTALLFYLALRRDRRPA
jgi:hypothetical protein